MLAICTSNQLSPITYGDISGHEEEASYREAVEKEFTSLAERTVFEKVNRADVPEGVEVGTGIVLVSKKRDGSYKARCDTEAATV